MTDQNLNELYEYKKKYIELETRSNQELQSLNQKLRQQEGNYEGTNHINFMI